MRYIGSKRKILGFIEKAVRDTGLKPEDSVFCDLFAGTGAVGRHFKEKGFSIIANDWESYSYNLLNHYIKNNVEIDISEELEVLNNMLGVDNGFIYNHYAPSGKFSEVITKKNGQEIKIKRMYFTDQNAKVIDQARMWIEQQLNNSIISQDKYNYLLAVIIEAVDKVANTTSVYGAFLKKFQNKALQKIKFKPLELKINSGKNVVLNEDAEKLIHHIWGDILYLDPPYNNRQYGANYHLLNTVAKYDNPEIKGVSGMRDYNISKWCKKSEVKESFENIISKARFKWVLFSYSNESIMTLKEIEEIMSKYGEYKVLKFKHQRYRSDKNSENRNYKSDSVYEYIHILEKIKF